MSFGARLREERRRLGFRQAEFAVMVGTDTPKQSLYENGHRNLRAAYLERVDRVGVDLIYVLTGRRSVGVLGEDATAFLDAYLALPEEMREPVRRLIAQLVEYAGRQERPWSPSALRPKEGPASDEG